MIKTPEIFEAARRGYSDLATATDEEILTYFNSIESPSISTHIINIEEILLEEKYLAKLSELGISTSTSKHPDLEIKLDKSTLESDQLKTSIAPLKNSESVADNLLKTLIVETLFPTIAIDYLMEELENM